MQSFIRYLAPFTLIGRGLAWAPPDYSSNGMSQVWVEEFNGDAHTLPNQATWLIKEGNLGVNDELETYTNYIDNVQLSGGATLQIIPQYNLNGIEWSSGRLESWTTFTPQPGVVTWAESCFRFGSNSQDHKQGIWPAVWLMGQGCQTNHSAQWPWCGEIDLMEELSGALLGYGTVHWGESFQDTNCDDQYHCQYQGTTSIPDYGWHYWRVEFDRTSNDWTSESITWYLDNNLFHTVHASNLNYDEDQWNVVAHGPLFWILNVAIGGWANPPNSNTWCGAGSMLEVAYVGVWQS